MARLLKSGEQTGITQAMIIEKGATEGVIEFVGDPIISVIPTAEILVDMVIKSPPGTMMMILGPTDVYLDVGVRFQDFMFSIPACVLVYTKGMKLNDQALNTLIVAVGGVNVCNMIHSIFKNGYDGVKVVIPDDFLARFPRPTLGPMLRLPPKWTGFLSRTLIAYQTDVEGLCKILKHPQHDTNTKVMSAYVSLFPYTFKDLIKQNHAVLSYTMDTKTEQHNRAELLALLGISVLGPAFLKDRRMEDRLARRIQMVAASLQYESPGSHMIANMITTSSWDKTQFIPKIIDVVASAVCRLPNGTYSREASVAQLASIDFLIKNESISPLAAEFLIQARRVYQNYQFRSIGLISFVVPRLNIINQPDNIWGLERELNGYRSIEDELRSAPYANLTYSSKYAIASFPRLVHLASKYYKSFLEDYKDIPMFRNYKVKDFFERNLVIPRSAILCLIDGLLSLLDPPETVDLARLVSIFSLEEGEMFMARQPPAVKKEILETLNSWGNPGEWAQNHFDEKNKKALKRVSDEKDSQYGKQMRIRNK